jgi:hypothetical protein
MTVLITVLVITAVVLRLLIWVGGRVGRHEECRATHTLGYCPMTRRASVRRPRRNRRCC